LVLLAIVSWADDVKALNAGARFAVHIGAAIASVATLAQDGLVFQGALPFFLDRLLAGLALLWFLNLYNFMDGIDGIAGAETVAIAAGYLAVNVAAGTADGPLFGLALATAGAALGFLVWNWPPARIFLGDVGSVPLGFLMGSMMLDLAVRLSLAAALILPLYFAADATITLARRLLKGEIPWEPHRIHFYQRAAMALGSHAPVVKRVSICNAILILAAMLALTAPLPAFVIAVGTVGALLINLELAARGAPSPAPE
jgi:UDP-N-acetylmuramyl pentapeptide phosphotransferase/UDP-N-acetylglucosamine-1-phosphate transferase